MFIVKLQNYKVVNYINAMPIQHLLESVASHYLSVKTCFLKYYLLYELERPYYSLPFIILTKCSLHHTDHYLF